LGIAESIAVFDTSSMVRENARNPGFFIGFPFDVPGKGRKNVLIAEKIVSLKQAAARVNDPSGFLPSTGNLLDQYEQSKHVSF